MEKAVEIWSNGWTEYIQAATDPLHRLSWQTWSLLLIVVLSAAIVALGLARASWRFSRPSLKGVHIKGGPHTYVDHLRVNVRDYMRFHRRDPTLQVSSDIVARDVAKDAGRYYVVTVVESGKFSPILSKEMRLQFASRRYAVGENVVQFDSDALTEIRLGNTSDEDDEAGADIAGTYDIYIRKVRWYDVRHWLNHPNREIRIVVWVTLITTTLPTVLDFLFG